MAGQPFIFPTAPVTGQIVVNPNVNVAYRWDSEKWMWGPSITPPSGAGLWGSLVWGQDNWG